MSRQEVVRETCPALPHGTSAYVVGTPSSLHIFGDIHLKALGQVYYGDIAINSVTEADAKALERSGQSNAVVFRYTPG